MREGVVLFETSGTAAFPILGLGSLLAAVTVSAAMRGRRPLVAGEQRSR